MIDKMKAENAFMNDWHFGEFIHSHHFEHSEENLKEAFQVYKECLIKVKINSAKSSFEFCNNMLLKAKSDNDKFSNERVKTRKMQVLDAEYELKAWEEITKTI